MSTPTNPNPRPNTKTLRLPLVSPASEPPLEQRISELGDVYMAAGYHIAAMVVIGSDALITFQIDSYGSSGTK